MIKNYHDNNKKYFLKIRSLIYLLFIKNCIKIYVYYIKIFYYKFFYIKFSLNYKIIFFQSLFNLKITLEKLIIITYFVYIKKI